MLDRLGAIVQKFQPTVPSFSTQAKPATSETQRETTLHNLMERASNPNVTLTPQNVTETRPLSPEEMKEVAALQKQGLLRMRWDEQTQRGELVPSVAGREAFELGTISVPEVPPKEALSPLKISLLKASRDGLAMTDFYTRRGVFSAEMNEAVGELLDRGMVEKRYNLGAELEQLHLTDAGRAALGEAPPALTRTAAHDAMLRKSADQPWTWHFSDVEKEVLEDLETAGLVEVRYNMGAEMTFLALTDAGRAALAG